MMKLKTVTVVFALITIFNFANADEVPDEESALKYLKELEPKYTEQCNKASRIRWGYETNVTKENEDASTAASNAFSEFQKEVQAEINAKFPNWDKFKNRQIYREFKNLAITGPANMSKQNVEAMNALGSKMESVYASTTVCQYKNPANCTFHLDPELTNVLKTSKDFNELKHYWDAWYDTLGTNVTSEEFSTFVKYQNEMAVANRFKDMSESWSDSYDDGVKGFSAEKFMGEMKDIWKKLKPYYSKLHAYVRMKLRPIYKDNIKKDGYLPMNILGNMWGQEWTNLDAVTKPFPDAPSIDATEAMKAANYDAAKIFKVSDEFFGNLGLTKMTDTFWKNSMLTRPNDGREVICHASAEDFCTGKDDGDYRIKMCTQVNMEDLVTVHHEMGHIEYYMQYNKLDFIFRTGANPGFHEAIGDALALAVTTPYHLTCVLELDLGLGIECPEAAGGNGTGTITQSGRRVGKGKGKGRGKGKGKGKGNRQHKLPNSKQGLKGPQPNTLPSNNTTPTPKSTPSSKSNPSTKSTPKPESESDESGENATQSDLPPGVTKTDINFLHYKALEKFTFFPFALSTDIWRFEVFSGKITKEQYTDRWWELKKEYQGLVPPSTRSSKKFDPAAKYHIVANVEYIRYFVSHILQFQFYEAMCIAAGEYTRENPKKPLYQCDFAGSKVAGKKLGDMLQLGFSKPWPEALEAIAGTKTLSIEPLMNYFKPLFDHIDKELKKAKEPSCFGKC